MDKRGINFFGKTKRFLAYILSIRFYRYRKRYCIDAKLIGWGRKRSGQRAVNLANRLRLSYCLLEDGFIRSVSLGEDRAFSIVKDDKGIYYDATSPSRLEEILRLEPLREDKALMQTAKKALSLIKTLKISKYNTGALKLPDYLKKEEKKVLIIAQTKGDLSLRYGYANKKSAQKMIHDAIQNNPDSTVYLKVHPDVLLGKKESNIDMNFAKHHCQIITEHIHPITLLEAFDIVYTQTSQMGFEALMLGKEVHIYGAPFYAGWHTQNLIWHFDRQVQSKILARRNTARSIEEIFAAAYICYSHYYNPYRNCPSDIIDTIMEIHRQRTKLKRST